jgi:hypothetical protein
MTIALISFTIANILTSMLGTVICKQKYQKSNKYVVFTTFFIGYFLLFYLLF